MPSPRPDPATAVGIRVVRVRAKGPARTEYQWRCPVCQETYWTSLSRKSETCSVRCAGQFRSARNPVKPEAQKRAEARAFVRNVNARTLCEHCGAQPVEWHNPEHVELKRQHFRIGRMVSLGSTTTAIQREMARCTPLCRRCHMAEDGRLKQFVEAGGGRHPKKGATS